jgi:hypothetical protein
VDELLDLVQQGLALAVVGFDVLLLEQRVDIGIAPYAVLPHVTAISSSRVAALPYLPVPHMHTPRRRLP